jgi:hypothetical protein
MRVIFFSVLLLNLAFLGWATWIDVPARATSGAAAVPSLALAGTSAGAGVPAGRSAAPATAPAAAASDNDPRSSGAAPAANPPRCVTVGPLADEAAVAGVAIVLGQRGLHGRRRTVDTQVVDGYWVYIPQLKDAAERRRVLARLNSAGMRDAAAMPQPERADRVSVGVFSDQNHAVKRAEQVRALGFAPTLEAHQRVTSSRWLDVDLRPGEAALQVTDFGIVGAPGLQVDDCPGPNAGG